MALIAATPGEARDVMIEGISGIMRVTPPDERPLYEPSKRRLTWRSGATATVYSGANPEQVRGFSGDTAWGDEAAAWRYPEDTWKNLLFGMREAQITDPEVLVTTTPKPIKLIRDLVAQCEDAAERGDPLYQMVTASSYVNRHNLSPIFYRTVIAPLEGTRLGEQEIHARLLSDDPRAHWKREWLDRHRVVPKHLPDLHRIVVGVDPAVTSEDESAETGIVVAGVDRPKGVGQHGYVLDDESDRYTPHEWGTRVVKLFHEYKADMVVAEVNNGGEMVAHTVQTIDPTVPVRMVRATRGKAKRFEPVANLDEQGRVHHVGTFGSMEDQMCTWVPGVSNMPSPDRADARVWALWDLMLEGFDPQTDEWDSMEAGLDHQPGWSIE